MEFILETTDETTRIVFNGIELLGRYEIQEIEDLITILIDGNLIEMEFFEPRVRISNATGVLYEGVARSMIFINNVGAVLTMFEDSQDRANLFMRLTDDEEGDAGDNLLHVLGQHNFANNAFNWMWMNNGMNEMNNVPNNGLNNVLFNNVNNNRNNRNNRSTVYNNNTNSVYSTNSNNRLSRRSRRMRRRTRRH